MTPCRGRSTCATPGRRPRRSRLLPWSGTPAGWRRRGSGRRHPPPPGCGRAGGSGTGGGEAESEWGSERADQWGWRWAIPGRSELVLPLVYPLWGPPRLDLGPTFIYNKRASLRPDHLQASHSFARSSSPWCHPNSTAAQRRQLGTLPTWSGESHSHVRFLEARLLQRIIVWHQ